ncbi:MAG: hypothetical protein M3347_05455, partial [Armatimonadota bacterium]|nr:hypothetical protein [Armatimonadota bacterium]
IRLILLLAAVATAAVADVPWHHPLYLDGGGYWPRRATLTVSSQEALNGIPQTVVVGSGPNLVNLIGAAARSIRVIDEDGNDLLYGLTGPGGEPKREGSLAAGDALIVPVECPAHGKRRLFVYFGNAQAGAVPDFLSGGFANGGFEAGDAEPVGWTKQGDDAEHVLEWVTDGPHSGRRCVRASASEKADASWFKYVQTGIPVVPGQECELRAWVRAENVKGSAGWYIHVNGTRPQLVNQVLNGGAGSYGWKELTWRFTVPEGAATADIGTVLHGTGRAWYDDCSFSTLATKASVQLSVGLMESADLKEATPQSGWLQQAAVRLPLRVYNFQTEAQRGALIAADIRRGLIVSRLKSPQVRVYDAATRREVPTRIEEGKLTFQADLSAHSVTTFHAYLAASGTPAGPALNPAALIVGPPNRVRNPDFEEGDALPTGWTLSAQRGDGTPTGTGRRVPGGKSGKFAVELIVPAGVEPAWTGWHQFVPVEPNGTYFIGAWMKTKDVDGSAMLHIHIRNAEKQLVSVNPMSAARTGLSGTTDWTWVQTTVTTPADARFIELHLTTNTHGTIWHDGVVLRRLADAVPTHAPALESRTAPGLAIWQASPMLKVFRDEPVGRPIQNLAVHLARNEREPVQLVLKSEQAMPGLQVRVTPLRNAAGQSLPAVEVAHVGYVPVDWPTNYYQITVPAWRRKIPTAEPKSDGWPGDWPDPLAPAGEINLAARQAQPTWLTIHAPESAAPGLYRGEVTISSGTKVIRVLPLAVTVHSFALPQRPSLQITYDLRGVAGEDARRWYRFMAEHRASPGNLPHPGLKLENGAVKMDFTEFDRAASYCFDELGMSTAYTPQYFYALGWAYSPQKFLGLKAFTPEWEKAFGSAYRQYVEHLRQKGWLDRITFYLSDEPFGDRKEVIENLSKFSKFLQSIAPEVPIYSSTWRHMPGLN